MSFGEKIKTGRENLGLTLAQASESLKISISYLSDFEHGRATKIKMDFIYDCAALYGINVDELCILARRVPKDIYYKITNNPKIFSEIRNLKV